MTGPTSVTWPAFAGGGPACMENAEGGPGVVSHRMGPGPQTDPGSGPSSTPGCLGDPGALEGDPALLSHSDPVYEGKAQGFPEGDSVRTT